MLFLCNGTKPLRVLCHHTTAVKTDGALLTQLVLYIFTNLWHARLRHAKQLHFTPCNLRCCLHKISAVGPYACFFHGNDRRSCRTGKAGHKSPAFKMFPHILRCMIIGGGNPININTVLLHQRPQRCDSLIDNLWVCLFTHTVTLLLCDLILIQWMLEIIATQLTVANPVGAVRIIGHIQKIGANRPGNTVVRYQKIRLILLRTHLVQQIIDPLA